MVFKKKRRLRDLLRAGSVILFFIGIPIWLLMIASIVNSVGLWIAFLLYSCVAYALCGRVEEWVM